MLYSDIVRALPPSVSNLLQDKLDESQLDADHSRAQALVLLLRAVEDTKAEMNVSSDMRSMVEMLLDQVPKAVEDVLFG